MIQYDYNKKKIIPFNENKLVRCRWLQDMFRRYEEYYRSEIARIIRNQRFYWGVNYGKWPSYVIEVLKSQGRTPPNYNISAKKIESDIGSFIANGFDMKWGTISGRKSDWAMHITDMALSDKRNCDWETSEIIAMRDMKVLVGYERMFVSDRFDSTFGNVAFEPLPPTHIYIDPSWKSPNAWDIDNYFEWGMFTIAQIIELFPHLKDELKDWKEREERTGINFGDYSAGVQRWQTTEQKWGDYHKVITYHSLYKYERDWEYDLVNRCPFPETGYPEGSEKEREAKQRYVEEAGLKEGDYTTIKQKKREKRIEVIIPTVHNELFAIAGKDRIQTNNCNIYPLGNCFYGQFRGMVDDLYDLDLDFNKNEMNMQDIMQRSAKGSYVMDEALTGGDEGKKREIEERANVPGAKIWVAEGATQDLGPRGGIVELPGYQPTPEMFNQAQRKLQLADWLTTPASMDSRSDVANPSGKLFQSQVQVGLVGQKYPMSILKRHKTEKMMAYALQAKITYSGYPRSFSRSNDEPLEINTRGNDPMGRRVVINNISTMPMMKVTLVQSISGLNVRTELREQYHNSLQYCQDPRDRLIKLIVLEGIFETQDEKEERKEELKRAFQILKINEATTITIDQKKKMAEAGQIGIQKPPMSPEEINAVQGEFSEEEAKQGTLQEQLQPNMEVT